MFLRNRSHFAATLSRGTLSVETGVVCVAVVVRYELKDRGALVLTDSVDFRRPPDIRGAPLWDGVSVTAVGTAACPTRPPYVVPLQLRVGDAVRRAIVFGDRRWERVNGALRASPPAPFDAIDPDFTRAFGGQYVMEPGVLSGTDIPHPGGVAAFPANPFGIGFYRDETDATGKCLPQLERPDQLVRSWQDRPEPVSFSPCPELAALRMLAVPATLDAEQVPAFYARQALRLLHYAPGDLIFDDVPSGTPFSLAGFAGADIAFRVPEQPVRVHARRGRAAELQPHLRAIHVDADARIVELAWAYAGRYASGRAPKWLDVENRGPLRQLGAS